MDARLRPLRDTVDRHNHDVLRDGGHRAGFDLGGCHPSDITLNTSAPGLMVMVFWRLFQNMPILCFCLGCLAGAIWLWGQTAHRKAGFVGLAGLFLGSRVVTGVAFSVAMATVVNQSNPFGAAETLAAVAFSALWYLLATLGVVSLICAVLVPEREDMLVDERV